MKKQPIDYEPIKRSHLWDKKPAADWAASTVEYAAAGAVPAGDTSQPEVLTPAEPREELWIVRRGHFLSYIGLFLFTAVVYFRPYELIPSLSGATSMAFWIAVVTLAIFLPSQLGVDNRLIPRIKEARLVLLLGLAGFLSVPFADDRMRAWNTFADFSKVVVMFVVMVSVVRTLGRLKGLIFLSLAVSVYLAIGAIAQHNSGTFKYDGYRVSGNIGNMFVNPNDLALFLVTILPLVVGLFLFTRNALSKLMYVVIVVLALITIVLTYSRGGFVALVAAVGVLIWKLQKRNRVVVLVPMVLIVAAFAALAPGRYGSRVASIGSNDDGSVMARRDDLKRSILVALRHPLFGVGMDNYVLRSNGNHATHNSYTQVAAEMGLPAFVVYVMFLISTMKRLRRIERETLASRKQKLYYLAVGVQAAMAGYLVGSFFASVVYLWNVYYLVGYAICLDRLHQTSLAASEPTPRGPSDHLNV